MKVHILQSGLAESSVRDEPLLDHTDGFHRAYSRRRSSSQCITMVYLAVRQTPACRSNPKRVVRRPTASERTVSRMPIHRLLDTPLICTARLSDVKVERMSRPGKGELGGEQMVMAECGKSPNREFQQEKLMAGEVDGSPPRLIADALGNTFAVTS